MHNLHEVLKMLQKRSRRDLMGKNKTRNKLHATSLHTVLHHAHRILRVCCVTSVANCDYSQGISDQSVIGGVKSSPPKCGSVTLHFCYSLEGFKNQDLICDHELSTTVLLRIRKNRK